MFFQIGKPWKIYEYIQQNPCVLIFLKKCFEILLKVIFFNIGFPFFNVRILLLWWNSSTAFFKKQCYKIEFNNFYGILKILMERNIFIVQEYKKMYFIF